MRFTLLGLLRDPRLSVLRTLPRVSQNFRSQVPPPQPLCAKEGSHASLWRTAGTEYTDVWEGVANSRVREKCSVLGLETLYSSGMSPFSVLLTPYK
jgi:hypothetical protein